MPPAHLDVGELLQRKAVGGRVGRAGHAGGEIRGRDPVPGRQEASRVGFARCARVAPRLCLGGRGSPGPPSPRDPREEWFQRTVHVIRGLPARLMLLVGGCGEIQEDGPCLKILWFK